MLRGWDQLESHIKAHPVEGSSEAMRTAFERLAPAPVGGTMVCVGGIECLRIGDFDQEPRLIWLHGGGLVFGSPHTHSAMIAALSERLTAPILIPQYRLAPEHVWPAPQNDVLACIDAMTGSVGLIGDSAGGMLALNAAINRPGKVARLALISPNTDRTGQSTTRSANSDADLMNDDSQDRTLAEMSFGACLDFRNDASPLCADLSALPLVWITAATNEVLLDDTLLLINALARQGRSVEAHVLPGLCHLWMLWPDALPQFAALFDTLADYWGDFLPPAVRPSRKVATLNSQSHKKD